MRTINKEELKNKTKSIRLAAGNGSLGLFAFLVCALLLPYLLRSLLFTSGTIGLTRERQAAIFIATAMVCSACLGIAVLRIRRLETGLDAALFSAVRIFVSIAPALALEILLFRAGFRGDSLLPNSILTGVLALLAVYAAVHTTIWATAILSERDALIPSANLWIKTWSIQLKNPVQAAGQFLASLLTFWCAMALFPLLSKGPLGFLYRSIAGSVLLAVCYGAVLTVFVRFLFRLASKIVAQEFPSEEEEDLFDSVALESAEPFDVSLAAKEDALNNPSSAQEILIGRGLLTPEGAYAKPAVRITDADIPVQKPLLPAKWSVAEFIPLLILGILLAYLAGTALIGRTTAQGVVDSVIESTRAAAQASKKANNTLASSTAYNDGLGDLEALDAYLSAIAGGVANENINEEAAQMETYAALFKNAEGYSDTTSFPYLLEAKLLLKDGHPDSAVSVLESMIARECDTDETYLLLLRAYRESGKEDSEAYKETRKICVSRRFFADELAYLDNISARDAETISASMQDAKDEFYLNGRLLLWTAYSENGEYETAYDGLYALLADDRYADNLDVLRAFLSTGRNYHVRLDGSGDEIDTFHRLTAEEALRYDALYTVARAAGETSTYTLNEIKHFVGSVLVDVEQYGTALDYLAEALGRYTEDEELVELYKTAYDRLPEEERTGYVPYEGLQFRR